MKTKALQLGHSVWLLLTEIPGWAEPSRVMRLRRALPILLPLAALLLLVGWNLAVRDPLQRATRREHAHLLGLERDIAALREIVTDQQAAESASRAREMAQRLQTGPEAITAQLAQLKSTAEEFGWDATFQASDTSLDTATDGAALMFLPVRARLAPQAANPAQLPSLLGLLERIPTSGKRIELTRLAVRADEQGKYAVELNLRLAARPTHEKTP